MIAQGVVDLAEKEKENPKVQRLKKSIKGIEKETKNLFNSLKLCEIDSVKKSIFEELAKMEEKKKLLKEQLLIEESQTLNITKTQVKFFLNQIKNGNIDDIRYKRTIINSLIIRCSYMMKQLQSFLASKERHMRAKFQQYKSLSVRFWVAQLCHFCNQLTNC